jgi:hypothetical protein
MDLAARRSELERSSFSLLPRLKEGLVEHEAPPQSGQLVETEGVILLEPSRTLQTDGRHHYTVELPLEQRTAPIQQRAQPQAPHCPFPMEVRLGAHCEPKRAWARCHWDL